MPPGYEPLLAAVCAAPWDDLPRLVFADWLDDHDEHDRAEFIRLQCDLSADPKNPTLRGKRAGQLLRQHREAWVAELPKLPGVQWRGFSRGFVAEAMVVRAGSGADVLPTLVAAAPVERLSTGSSPDGFRWLTGSDAIRGLTRLDVADLHGPGCDDEAVEALARNPASARLRHLCLRCRRQSGFWVFRSKRRVMTDRTALALLRSPHLTRVENLILDGADLSPGVQDMLSRRFGRDLSLLPQW